MKRNRLLVVVHYPTFGGPHNRALQLAPYLRECGWHTTVLLPNERGNAVDRLRENGVDVVLLSLGRARATKNALAHARYFLGFWPQVESIRRLIRERRIDVVLVGGLINPHGAVAARLAGLPLVWQVVDTRTPRYLRSFLMSLADRLANAVMFNGRRLIDFHGRTLRVPTFTYFPPVDTRRRFVVSPTRKRLTRKQLGIPQEAPVVGTVANISPQKGIEYFIGCAAIVWRAMPETRFIVVGAEYAYKQQYNEIIAEEVKASGIPLDHLMFLGARSDVEDYYAAMDVKLVTSVPNSEGTTTTAMEAMACGVPVVATDVGAVSEVVDNNVTGYVVPSLDAGALARATLNILQDSQRRARLGEEARARACKLFDTAVCADQHAQALEAAIYHYERHGRSFL